MCLGESSTCKCHVMAGVITLLWSVGNTCNICLSHSNHLLKMRRNEKVPLVLAPCIRRCCCWAAERGAVNGLYYYMGDLIRYFSGKMLSTLFSDNLWSKSILKKSLALIKDIGCT